MVKESKDNMLPLNSGIIKTKQSVARYKTESLDGSSGLLFFLLPRVSGNLATLFNAWSKLPKAKQEQLKNKVKDLVRE